MTLVNRDAVSFTLLAVLFVRERIDRSIVINYNYNGLADKSLIVEVRNPLFCCVVADRWAGMHR